MKTKINEEKIEVLETKENKTGVLISKLDHPITISYKGLALKISPKQKIKIADINLLGAIPSGIILR